MSKATAKTTHFPHAAQADKWDLDKILNTDISFSSRKFTDPNKDSFYLELSMLLSSGLDIKTALELIEQEQAKEHHRALIKQLQVDLVAGSSLWEAMKKSSQFTPYEYHSVQIGEETGQIIGVLEQLHNFFAAKIKQRQQLVAALSYPLVILLTSIGAVTFMMLFVVPMFNDVFKRFGGELPAITLFIIRFSQFVQNYFLIWLAIVLGGIFFLYRNRQSEWFEKYSARLVFRIPVVGSIVYSLQLARFCSSMSMLLGAKVPLIRSLELVEQMIRFYPIRISLRPIADEIFRGNSLHNSMATHKVYGRRMISLVKVGEEVNKLDVFFEKLAKQESASAQHQTSLLNTFLEPAMIIFLGIVVGFILMAMYLPMFQLSTSIG